MSSPSEIASLLDAQARGARIWGELAGAGITADSHDMVQPNPTGETQVKAMTKALREADLVPGDIVHVNAHATATPLGDVAEAKAIRAVFGYAADDICLTAPKSMIGHLLGAAGAVETLAVVLSLYERIVPPTINVDNVDPEIDLDIVIDGPRKLPDGDLAALNNSFGFGGHNVAVAFTNSYRTGGSR